MATTTKVYGLKKPSLTDIYNIMDFNNNFDKIDDVLNTKTEIEDIGTLNGTESVFNTQISPGFYKGILTKSAYCSILCSVKKFMVLAACFRLWIFAHCS